jgi:hypothetical protein
MRLRNAGKEVVAGVFPVKHRHTILHQHLRSDRGVYHYVGCA